MYVFIVAKPDINSTQMSRYENWHSAIVTTTVLKNYTQFGWNGKCHIRAIENCICIGPKRKMYSNLVSNRYDKSRKLL